MRWRPYIIVDSSCDIKTHTYIYIYIFTDIENTFVSWTARRVYYHGVLPICHVYILCIFPRFTDLFTYKHMSKTCVIWIIYDSSGAYLNLDFCKNNTLFYNYLTEKWVLKCKTFSSFSSSLFFFLWYHLFCLSH